MKVWVLTAAIRLAAEAHNGQFDKQGRPYILHPMRLMVRAKSIEAQIVAVLHDVVEDCQPLHAEKALALAESLGLRGDLEAVTSRWPEETYAEFTLRSRDHGPISREVKILDVEDHIEQAGTPETRGMVKSRYAKALRVLKGEED